MDKKTLDAMLAMRHDGKSYGAISKAFGQKYPAWSRHYLLKAEPDLKGTEAKKPPSNHVQRTSAHSQDYDMPIEYRHGDGHSYGCGEVVIVTQLHDPNGDVKCKAAMLKHKMTCTKREISEPASKGTFKRVPRKGAK